MHNDNLPGRRGRASPDDATLRWQEAMLGAQHSLGEDIAHLIGNDGLVREAYLRWLVSEHALCRCGADALEAIAPALAAPALREWAGHKAALLHDWERMAAADVRRTDGIVVADPVAVDPWRDYVDRHARWRPYRALGAIALNVAVTGGTARGAILAVLERSFLPVRGCTYLLHRLLAADDSAGDWRWLWQHAPDAAARQALGDGAWRGATLYRRIVRTALGSSAKPAARRLGAGTATLVAVPSASIGRSQLAGDPVGGASAPTRCR